MVDNVSCDMGKVHIRVGRNQRALLYRRRVDWEDMSVPVIIVMVKRSHSHIRNKIRPSVRSIPFPYHPSVHTTLHCYTIPFNFHL
jgi:hypothetical protein